MCCSVGRARAMECSTREPGLRLAAAPARILLIHLFDVKDSMGSLVKKRRKKMSKHKYRKRIKANRHKKKR